MMPHGVCVCVCIFDHIGELFNFDAEVEPLLEVLVGKVLEQALMEVSVSTSGWQQSSLLPLQASASCSLFNSAAHQQHMEWCAGN